MQLLKLIILLLWQCKKVHLWKTKWLEFEHKTYCVICIQGLLLFKEWERKHCTYKHGLDLSDDDVTTRDLEFGRSFLHIESFDLAIFHVGRPSVCEEHEEKWGYWRSIGIWCKGSREKYLWDRGPSNAADKSIIKSSFLWKLPSKSP